MYFSNCFLESSPTNAVTGMAASFYKMEDKWEQQCQNEHVKQYSRPPVHVQFIVNITSRLNVHSNHNHGDIQQAKYVLYTFFEICFKAKLSCEWPFL